MGRAIDADELKKYCVECGEGFVLFLDKLFEMIDKQPTIEPKREWISVKDRLPEEYTRVLTYSHADGVMIGSMDYDGDFRFPYCLLPDEPTHWMPLPEPPEKE